MVQIISLALPFFGLIFLGFGAGKLVRRPEEGLAWMNIFLIYFSLPALFYRIISKTPFEQLGNWGFIAATTASTFAVFALAFGIGLWRSRGNVADATLQGIAGSYSNVGYMGPGLTLSALGPSSTVPTALIFCFDSALLFTLLPLLMGVAGGRDASPAGIALQIVRRVFLHPFIIATLVGVVAAYYQLHLPQAVEQIIDYLKNAAAPCALFAMGVTVALRPLKRVPAELPHLMLIKLVLHPFLVWAVLGLFGPFEPAWTYTAVLMAALPPALNVFIMARQYNIYVERASSVVLVGTLISVVTLTGFLYLVVNGILPLTPFGR